MRKLNLAAMVTAVCLIAASCGSNNVPQDTFVTWETLGNEDSTYTQRFTITGNIDMEKIGFNMFHRRMQAADPADTVETIMPGYYALKSPRLQSGADTVVIDIITHAQLMSCAYAPDGVHAIMSDGSTHPIKYTRLPLTEPNQWRRSNGTDRMPYGDAIYDINESLQHGKADVYDVVPSYKKVTITDGMSKLPLSHSFTKIESDIPEYYVITVKDGDVNISAANERTAQMALRSFQALVLDNGYDEIPNAIIEDYPDFGYRGLMIDVSRNFQPIESMQKIVDLMTEYRLNRLHFHLIDDEAWRLEIPGFPELTEFGARRGYSTDEHDYLWQLFAGDGNPDTKEGTANGYYTRQEFIDFLKYADERGVAVIPEFEMPGHARAARMAMEKRYRDTGDDTFRLVHDGDTSKYVSAQSYGDNVMNPALPGPYKFVDAVLDEIIKMYDEAEVPLLTIHIGGDEVARGAWNGSEAAQKLIADEGLNGQTGLHGYFVDKVAEMFRQKGQLMSGWQEIAVDHTDKYNEEMAPLTYGVNCWTNSNPNPDKNITVKALRAGFPVIISNVDNYYLDMAYNYHPEEPGLTWGGVVDEFKALHGYPAQMCPIDIYSQKGKVIGVSAHVWAETIRSPQMLQLFLFPKMLGFAERAWNAEPTYDDADFNAVVAREMPRWNAEGTNFHLRQPGIKVIDGKIMMNAPYSHAEIRFTTDGAEPTAESPLYSGPIDAQGISQVRARLYHQGKQSLTTYLYM